MNNNVCLLCDSSEASKEESELFRIHLNHSFCWIHIENYIKESPTCQIKCPAKDCRREINQNQIKTVLSQADFDAYLDKSLNEGLKNDSNNTFICLNQYCKLPVILDEDKFVQYECSGCQLYICTVCNASHMYLNCQDFNCLPDSDKHDISQQAISKAENKTKVERDKAIRKNLEELDKRDVLNNDNPFECETCLQQIRKNKGLMLRNCFHNLCKDCLYEHIKSSPSSIINCPIEHCKNNLESREIMHILKTDEERNQFNLRELSIAKSLFHHKYTCRGVNCVYFCEKSPTAPVEHWRCPRCKSNNCELCQSVHDPARLCPREEKKAKRDEEHIEEQIRKKKLMRCLNCKMLLQKTRGCNWIQCSSCNTELCWINQSYRWGPKGRGDTSGGCRCGVDNKRCHPDCSQTCEPH